MSVGVAETPSAAFKPADRLTLLREVVRRPSGLFGLVVVGILLIVAAVPALFAPYSVDGQDIPSRLQTGQLFKATQLHRACDQNLACIKAQ